jgi:RNA polymerase sigma factor (sigma-70 family)
VTLDEPLLPRLRPATTSSAERRHALAVVHPRKSEVVGLRYFGGLSLEETAEALHVSIDTVKRDWRFAKMWLLRELGGR